MKFLLVGNPNVGKSTFFNVMTKSNVKVANYTGITVDTTTKKMYGNQDYVMLDLPGTYSVLPNSGDEGVVTQTLLHDTYNGVVNILNATHLKRNLHLTLQLLELGVPTVIVANMHDELERSGYKIDHLKMETLLNVPVVPFSATKSSDTDAKHFVSHLDGLEPRKALHIEYGDIVESAIKEIKALLRFDVMSVKKRWMAIQLLEGNDKIYEFVDLQKKDEITEIIKRTEQEVIEKEGRLSLKGSIFLSRRLFIEQLLDETLIQVSEKNHIKSLNRKLDDWLTHPLYGTFLFAATMFLIYHISFGAGFLGIGTWLTDLFDVFYHETFLSWVANLLNAIGLRTDQMFGMLIIDGALTGVGGVLIFLPQIITLFILLSALEGTGYMSRVAISMDGLLSKFGLNGKSIVPMVTGFGCTVPAVMSTRTIPSKKERILTMLSIPFISCAARLPIYGFFVSIFFEQYQALIIMFIYVLGIVVTLLSAKLFSLSFFKNEPTNFALELPPYRLPNLKNIWLQALDRAKAFLKKAGTIIFFGSIAIWFLTTVGVNGATDIPSESYLANIARYIAPVFAPLGFGTWEASSALVTGILAKEVVIASLTVLYGTNGVAAAFGIVSALTFVIFSALYTPCLSTIAIIKAETNSLKWTAVAVLYPLIVAYVVAYLFRLLFIVIL